MDFLPDNAVFGFIRPVNDAHTLGISSISNLLEECGFKTIIANAEVSRAVSNSEKLSGISRLSNWINSNSISYLGFSYRLDPGNAQQIFGKIYNQIRQQKLFIEDGGILRKVFFAGLPDACKRIKEEYNDLVITFEGDDSQFETLTKIGVPRKRIPNFLFSGSEYDKQRWDFASTIIKNGQHNRILPNKKPSYANLGTKEDSLVERLTNQAQGDPIIRVHVGPYNPDYKEAKKEFLSWCKVLSETGFLDIISIGSSQLSQSDFESDWGEKPNGGGVPINSKKDLYDIWFHSRPLLVRTYAGTRNIPYLASVYEETINTAWHALSFWWFNKIDGRGPYDVYTNLQQHFETLKVIAKAGKPFEPNVPHHFAFRGGDDISYILSGYLAAKAAKKAGIKHLVLQTMLNTPKYTIGIYDLAKTRALLNLVRSLEDRTFNVFLQPRAGLDYFSPDQEKARIQLATVTAMMDDIEPENPNSPEIIHVVSYSEAKELATPGIINESIQITKASLKEYRKAKKQGFMQELSQNEQLNARTSYLISNVSSIIRILENSIDNLYSPEGFYNIFKKGVFPVPYLWEGREEFKNAVNQQTRLINGGVEVIREDGTCMDSIQRVKALLIDSNPNEN